MAVKIRVFDLCQCSSRLSWTFVIVCFDRQARSDAVLPGRHCFPAGVSFYHPPLARSSDFGIESTQFGAVSIGLRRPVLRVNFIGGAVWGAAMG